MLSGCCSGQAFGNIYAWFHFPPPLSAKVVWSKPTPVYLVENSKRLFIDDVYISEI